MRKAGYQFRSGSRLKGGKKEANRVGRELDRLGKTKRGSVEAEDVVRAAQSRQSPLHNHFEWDNTEAAKQYRLEQAREMLRSIEVRYIDEERDEEIVVRAFVNLRRQESEGQPYITSSRVLGDKELRERWVRQALDEAQEWMKRYENIRELAKVFSAIKATSRRLKKKAKKKKKARAKAAAAK